jgi:hypothetical protein
MRPADTPAVFVAPGPHLYCAAAATTYIPAATCELTDAMRVEHPLLFLARGFGCAPQQRDPHRLNHPARRTPDVIYSGHK